jgi:Helix-turn-helix domain
MPKRYKIMLNEKEQQKLESWVKSPPRAYLRERARAILEVSKGESIQATAEKLRVRVHRNAVAEWVKRFLSERLQGLKIKTGRGRKSVFSPYRERRSQKSS